MTQLTDGDDDYHWWNVNAGEEAGLIFAGDGDDWVDGDRGDDIIYGQGGRDHLFGGPYNHLSPSFYPYDANGIPGFWGNDHFIGGDGFDSMVGGTGNDIFEGGDGIDSMYGGGGNDTFYPGEGDGFNHADGGDGDDIFYAMPNGGNNSFYGGNGSDWVIFGYLNSSAVTVDLLRELPNTGVAAGDTYLEVENLRGSFGADTLRGDNNPNILDGGPGNSTDTLYGRGGIDILRGQDGDDNLFGGEGADWIDGGAGSDTANYQDAPTGVTADFIHPGTNTGFAAGDQYAFVENLIGSQSADGLGGDDNPNIILGGGGNDFIGGRGGNDSLWGESGDDALTGDAGADDLHGGPGIDAAVYWYAPSRVLADLLFPGLNTREVNDANGDTYDQIENLGGSRFDDHLGGNDFANLITGYDGNDLIAGRGGADLLLGEVGNDTLIGDAGDDTLDGGPDTDTAVFSGLRSAYTLTNLGGGSVRVSGPDGVDTLSGIERLQFSDATLSVPATLFDPLAFKLAAFAPGAGGWINQARYPRDVADVNGDGFGDIVGFGDAGVFVSLGSASGFGSIEHRLAAFGLINGGWSSNDRYPRHLADVNGDGMADIVGFGDAGVFVSLATGGGSFGPSVHRLAAFGAVNGGWFSDDRYHRELADVNGDGMADIVGFGDAGVFVSLATGGGTFGPVSHRLGQFFPAIGWTSQDTYPRHLADVNGDGKADIVGFGQAGVYVSLATMGGNFSLPSFVLAGFGRDNGWHSDNVYPRELADVNGDGKADIVGFGDAGTWIALATGGGSFQPMTLDLAAFGQNGGWSSDNTYPRVLADINHDHVADIVGFGQAGVYASPSSAFLLI